MSKRKNSSAQPRDVPLGERLRYWRSRLRLTQTEVEQRAGLAHNALSRIENGQVDPQFDTIKRVAEAMGMSFEELQQRPIPTAPASSTPDAAEDVVAGLEALPPEKREQVIQAFLQILRQFDT